MVTKEVWVDWRDHPCTQQLVESIRLKRAVILEGIGQGQASGDQIHVAIGRTQGHQDDVDYILRDFEYMTQEGSNNGR